MKKIKLFAYYITFTGVLFAFFCACIKKEQISSGEAIITGKIIGIQDSHNENPIDIKLFVPNLISEEMVEYEIQCKEDGTFEMNVPLLNASFVYLILEEKPTVFYLSPCQKNRIDISFDDMKIPQVKIKDGKELTTTELQQMGELNQKILESIQDGRNAPHLDISASPMIYRDSMLAKMGKDLSILNDSKISEKIKQIIRNDLKFFYLYYDLFNYEENMQLIYLNRNKEKKLSKQNFIPIKPDKQYYSFLKDFDLNQPPYYNYLYYSLVLESILTNEILNIPPVGDMPINDWQKEVSTILKELTNLDTGLFYDLLTAKTYFLQMKNKLKPLSNKQKENIQNYFKNHSYMDFLFTKNEEIITELSYKLPFQINETPTVSKEKLMESILSKYKGKVVMVDFWATWCNPCLQAMQEIKSLKAELHEKNIVFVYITNPSSQVETWETKIQTIGGEHYYLTKEEWDYISNHFDFKGIPTYAIYDSNGHLKNKITAYPGNDRMREMIETLLP